MIKRRIKKVDLHTLASVITILGAIAAIINYFRGGVKMVLYFLTIKIDSFWLIMAIAGLILLLLNINVISPLGRKSKKLIEKYDKLVELAKLPKTFDRAITVEESPNWDSDPIIITKRYGEFPHLRFDMRVINRTYHSYEAEEATVKCFCGSGEVYKGTWDNITKKSETFEWVNNLPVWGQGDGKIMFHVPIKELDDDMTTWRLRGKVKYKSKDPLIDDNQYANPEIDIELEYIISEKQILALKKEVEKASGDDI
jgi:hypothetical protein